MFSVLNLIMLTTFAANLSFRAMDPVLPQVADDLAITIAHAAGLSAGMTFSIALIQPVVGAAADLFGKVRLMLACLILLGVASIVGAFTTSFTTLLITRILCGIGAGGVFPSALSLASDLVPVNQRQVALSRVLAGVMIGNVLGASVAGVIGDFMGWRGVLVVMGLITICAATAAAVGLNGRTGTQAATGASLATLKEGYRVLFTNPKTLVCYGVVFIEGACIMGIFPFVAAFLFELGETRLSIAGVVIAGFAVGGLVYVSTVALLLPRVGVPGLMVIGALLAATQLLFLALGPSWQVQTFSFLIFGLGFYMIHGCMQVFSSELSENARATSMALHACFFFLGQAVGSMLYGVGISHIGKTATLSASVAVFLLITLSSIRFLTQPRPR